MSERQKLPFGAWPSPITAKFITTSGVRLGAPSIDSKTGALHWLEGRPQEGGRQVVVKYVGAGSEGASSRGAVDVTPEDNNVRTRVHEYGGGDYVMTADGGVIFSDFKTQRLYKSGSEGGPAECITPEASYAETGRYRFADAQIDPSGAALVAVREDHGEGCSHTPAQVVNEVVSVALDGSGKMTVLATGNDFYAAPRVSPDGASLAYVTWNHPNMPWDATELRLAPYGGAGSSCASSDHTIVDGADGETSVLQPAWHPASGALYYVSDASGYYNLCRVPPGGSAGVAILPRDVDFGGSAPGWRFGQQGFAFTADGGVAAPFPDRSSGRTALVLLEDSAQPASSAVVYGEADGLPHSFSSLTPAKDGTLYMLGGGPDSPPGIYAWHGLSPTRSQRSGATTELLASSSSSSVPSEFVSLPRPVEFPSPLGTSFGYFYPPTNPNAFSDEAAPPLLVKAHGGPTACTSTGFNPTIQFFTSRGFAVLDVDYGGSTGYGREYRRRLRGQWGVVDIDDVCAGAQYCVREGLADAKRLAIDGGSAGGYTTLGALAFRDVFTAGCSLYGVADLSALAGDTHKFESRYLDGLVGKFPEEEALYAERAPIKAVDKLSCPILLLQGDEDKIVPPNQAELMHEALLAKGLPCALKMYEGEQHGFRKAQNIEDALNSELYFFSQVYGFSCAGDDIVPFAIDNLAGSEA